MIQPGHRRHSGLLEAFVECNSLLPQRQVGVGILPQCEQRIENFFCLYWISQGQIIGGESVVRGDPSLLRLPKKAMIRAYEESFILVHRLLHIPRLLVCTRQSFRAERRALLLIGKAE